jgi:hypothetical protein
VHDSIGFISIPEGGNEIKPLMFVLTLFSVKHTDALDRAGVGNPLVELLSTGQSNRLGGGGGWVV